MIVDYIKNADLNFMYFSESSLEFFRSSILTFFRLQNPC